MSYQGAKIATIIPCYRVKDHILQVIAEIPDFVDVIYCIDDACPEGTADFIETNCQDIRVVIIRHAINQGVGGAVISGYKQAKEDDCIIAVKIDGDGQMQAVDMPFFINPIIQTEADYTKGNRFYTVEGIKSMPPVRLLGNAILSFIAKISTGYWSSFDPTNGYTAIHLSILDHLSLEKVAKGYFFESDLLFRLNIARCVIKDIPMTARYEEEQSNLKIHKITVPFMIGHCRNIIKRFAYSYFIRDFNLASIELILGIMLGLSGSYFGATKWIEAIETNIPATAGTVMIAAIQLIISLQLILSAINYDMNASPKDPLHRIISKN